MTAGLFRLGHDFGNGEADGHFLQRDKLAPRYRKEKEKILAAAPRRLQAKDDPAAQALQQKAVAWMRRQLHIEHGLAPELGATDTPSARLDEFRRLSLVLQEDFALLQESTDGKEELVLLSVCFPSGWRPEALLGQGFDRIHAPIPEFGHLKAKSRQIVQAMIHRGPYVRFAWSLTADARLDHHPDQAPRDPWTENSTGYLRVERQVTVPFPDLRGSLFLIRTYLYALEELSAEQRDILFEVTESLPDSIKSYKGFSPETQAALARASGRTPASIP